MWLIFSLLKHFLGGELLLCLQLTEKSIDILVLAHILDLASTNFWNFVKSMKSFHIIIQYIVWKLKSTVCMYYETRRKCDAITLNFVLSRRSIFRGINFVEFRYIAKVLIWQKNDNFCVKIGSSNLTSFHRKEISEICSHTFLTKISWKQRFYKLNVTE